MGSIITLASQKGGAGKSTIATVLALTMTRSGRTVSVIDADPNGGLASWFSDIAETGDALPCFAESDEAAMVDRANTEAERRDFVILDTAGFANPLATFAMGAADLVLIPAMPDRGSVREALRAVSKVQAIAKAARRKIAYRVVRTQWLARGLADQAAEADFAENKVRMAETALPSNSAFRKVTFSGSLDYAGPAGIAAERLTREVVKIMEG